MSFLVLASSSNHASRNVLFGPVMVVNSYLCQQHLRSRLMQSYFSGTSGSVNADHRLAVKPHLSTNESSSSSSITTQCGTATQSPTVPLLRYDMALILISRLSLGKGEAIKTITIQVDRFRRQLDRQRPTASATVALVLLVVMSLERTPMTTDLGADKLLVRRTAKSNDHGRFQAFQGVARTTCHAVCALLFRRHCGDGG